MGALAIAAERANAIGAVRLTLARDALEVELLRVGSFSTSFVPGALVEMVRFQAPYLSVRGLVEKDGALCLAFDPNVVAPFNRFTLSRFTDAPLEALVGAHRARVRWRTLATLLPLPVGVLAAWLLPEAMASGWLGRLAIGVLVSLGVHYAMRELARWVTFGGPISRHYRETFERRLAARLEIAPVLSPDLELPVDVPTDEPLAPPIVHVTRQETASAPRARFRMAFALAAVVAFLVGSIAFIKEYAAPRRFQEAVELAAASEAVPGDVDPRPSGPSDAQSPTDDGASEGPPSEQVDYDSCVCARADSPLWRGGLPALSVLPSSRDRDESGRPSSDVAAKPDEEDIYRFDFDIAVVNNTDDSLSDIKTVLTFARRNENDERVGATDRGLFWEGELGPGRAVKWQVEAPGTEMRIDGPDTPDGAGSGLLQDDAVAPADRFFRLTSARQRVVRLHGAMMLAYLGDPRARDAAMGLSGLSLDEERVRDAVVRASSPLKVCGAEGDETDFSVCVFNGTSKPAPGLLVREVIETGTAREVEVMSGIPVHEGFRVPFPLGDGPPPSEVVVAPSP